MSGSIPAVLIVDDEELVVSSLRGAFALSTDYRVLESTNPRRALELVRTNPLDVVISDFLMPELNGIDFLREVRRLQPEAARILLTGYADKENAIRAINEVGLYQYIEKPWDNQALLLVVSNAIQERGLRRELAAKIAELDSLLGEMRVLSDRQQILERELEMAARVHRGLLPEAFPQIEGFRFAGHYLPCEALGGDFYDFARSGNRTVVLLADVMGHGLQAALSTTLLKGIFQETAPEAGGPVALLEAMNDRLSRLLPRGMYAAASAVYLEPGSSRLQLVNAGLPYPFVLRASGASLEELPISGSPLGLFPGGGLVPYEPREVVVGRADVLLLGSDGLGSVPGADGEYFGDRELRRTVAELGGRDGGEIIERLLERAQAFSRGQRFPDDVNLLAITGA